MAKKSKNKSKQKADSSESLASRLSKETLNAILGVLSIVVTIFLLMASIDKGGSVGEMTYWFFSYLFGVGYYLLPLVFAMLSVSFFKSKEKDFALTQGFGSLLFFVSSLGLTDLVFPLEGGVIGGLISRPLMSLFDFYLSAIILVALIVISLLIIFDTSINLNPLSLYRKIFKKKEASDQEEMVPVENAAVEKAVQELQKEPETNQNERDRRGERQDRRGSKEESEGFVPLLTRRLGKAWTPPPLTLLEKDRGKPGVGDIKANANQIKRTLLNFGIVVEMDEISVGPSVTRYSLKPAEGVKLSRILGLQNNLELALAAHPVRIEAPIPGKSLVGIEVPNTSKATIGLGSLLTEPAYADSDKPLLVALGRDVSGHTHFANMAKMPHCLVAGATGSGKSVTIHAIVNSLLFRNPPENLKFILIDPKRVELTLYNKIPHLLTPVITDAKKAILALKWAGKEMDRRYDILEKMAVRDIDSYHKTVLQNAPAKNAKGGSPEEMKDGAQDPMPYIVIIIDELADLMQAYPRELEAAIVRLAQMSRAVGIHLLLSTQRPSVNVITGLIKANIPARIALQVASQIDSRTILDSAGAEKLLGAGDMLYVGGEMSKPERIQSSYITEGEVKKVVKYLIDAYVDELNDQIDFANDHVDSSIFSSALDPDANGDDDELYEEAREVVLGAGKASTSFLQRKLRIGYAWAARLIDLLEERGVVGPGSGAKPREVIGATAASSGFAEQDEEV